MPKVARTVDPMVGKASASKQARMSSSSSPLVPQLSIHLSPQHTEDSNEVAQINYPCNNAFPLLSSVDRSSRETSKGSLSPNPSSCLNSKLDQTKVSPDLKRGPTPSGSVSTVSLQSATEDGINDLKGKDAMDTSDESLQTMQHSNNDLQVEKDLWREDSDECKRQDSIDDSGDNRKADRQSLFDIKPRSTKERDYPDLRSGNTSQTGIETEAATSCALTGYVTLATRNGDSFLHGVLPPVLSPHQGTTLNTCFPASDGSWYQIISAGLPPILSSQSLADKGNKVQTNVSTSTQCVLKDSTAAYNPLSLLSSLSLPTSAALTTATTTSTSIVAPLPSPVSTSDPLLSLLQQYAAGTACGSDLQSSLSALHLPLNVTSAGVAAAATGGSSSHASPRYLYATNPRTGQLLILSSVGELTGAQTLQPIQLQPQIPLQQVLQLQQPVKMQEKTAWKSPLRLNQSQNNVPTTSGGLTAGKQTKPASVVSKLLNSKIPSSLSSSGKHDENMPSVAAARELLALASPGRMQVTGQSSILPPLFHSSPDAKPSDEPVRENHNMKERRRRARIKDACDLMRQLVPGMSEKTDKATVFEFSARYIHFLKNFVGTHHDKDFLIKYSPY